MGRTLYESNYSEILRTVIQVNTGDRNHAFSRKC